MKLPVSDQAVVHLDVGDLYISIEFNNLCIM